MRSYTLKIAGYNILFAAAGEGIALSPSPSQRSFITHENSFDLVINISRGSAVPDTIVTEVFRAPYVEEINGVMVKKGDKFWTVSTHGDYILVNSTLPLSETQHEALLTIRPGEKSWDMVIDSEQAVLNPFCYPMDGLILYYLAALNGDIFIHGSAVEYQGRGYLFSGRSGTGKTTIARLFRDGGARIIHDDRLIIRRMPDGTYFIYNTPVYENEESRSCRLNALYLIEHGIENNSVNQGYSESLSGIMANCIQHNWSSSLIGNLTGALLHLVNNIPVKRLLFVPDASVTDYITGDA